MSIKEISGQVFNYINHNRILSLVYLTTAIVVVYFLYYKAFPKLILTEEMYGSYYWPKAPWLFAHVVTGIAATFIGPLQFFQTIRDRFLVIHQRIGLTYFICISISAITALVLAFLSHYNAMGKISLGIVPLVWIATIGMAILALQRKKYTQHGEWMIRSYVVTLFFVIFVTINEYLPYQYFGSYSEALPFLTWVSWTVPLFATELMIQGRKILR